MSWDFTIISIAHESDKFKISRIAKRLPKKIYMNYLLKELPINMTEFICIGEKQREIILPFTQSQINEIEIMFINEFIEKVMDKYNVVNVCFSDKLRKYLQKEKISYHNLFNYMVLDQLIEEVVRKYQLIWRNVRLVIIDSGDSKTDYILEMVVRNSNYLSIVTKREEYFTKIKEIIYDNTGLVIETLKEPLKEMIDGDLVIDASKTSFKNYNYFKQNGIVLDLETSPSKIQYQYSRRKDLNIIYDIILTARGEEEVDKDLIGQLLCSKSFICDSFVKESCKDYRVKDFLELAREYNIILKKVKLLKHLS